MLLSIRQKNRINIGSLPNCNHSLFKFSGLMLLVFGLSSCVGSLHKQQIAEFSTATDVLIQGTKSSLAKAQESELEYQIAYILINKTDLRPQYFDPILDKDAIQKHLDVLDLLDTYSEALSKIANNDESKTLEASARNFVEKSDSLASNLGGLGIDDDNKKLLGQAVLTIGSAITEGMKSGALRKTISEANGPIQEFSRIMAEQLGDDLLDSNGVMYRTGLREIIWQQYEVRRRQLETEYPTTKHKEILIREYLSLLAERDAIQGLISETREALLKFSDSHNTLNKSIPCWYKPWTWLKPIKLLEDQVDALQVHVSRIRDFQLKLEEE